RGAGAPRRRARRRRRPGHRVPRASGYRRAGAVPSPSPPHRPSLSPPRAAHWGGRHRGHPVRLQALSRAGRPCSLFPHADDGVQFRRGGAHDGTTVWFSDRRGTGQLDASAGVASEPGHRLGPDGGRPAPHPAPPPQRALRRASSDALGAGRIRAVGQVRLLDLSTPSVPGGHRLSLLERRPLFTAAVFACIAIAVAAELGKTAPPDMAFLLYAAGRLLDGATLYRDVVEINPPLVIWLNVPIE